MANETVTTASGLQYIDDKVGDGASPQKGKRVTVHYTGTLTTTARSSTARATARSRSSSSSASGRSSPAGTKA